MAEVLQVDAARARTIERPGGGYQPLAVIDIGSNSVRLVIYEGAWRHAHALHNEKAICAIGRNMVSTGRLDQDGMEYALETLARFRALCEGHGVKEFGAVATAAARDASNGREFVREAEMALGQPIRILSGEDEAKIAAEGALAGIPQADGLVADLGGGSLDMVKVNDGKTGAAATLPFGPLRLMDLSEGNLTKARNAVEKGLGKLEFTSSLKGKALYAVGGIWRALAHVDMEQQAYPLRVLHHYVMPAKRAVQLSRVVAGLGRKSLEKMAAVPKRRAEALPYGALVMEEMIHAFALKEVVISAYGLREGVLQRKLAPEEADKDPLIEHARDVNAREARTPGHAAELFRWMTPLFPKEADAERRIREAACFFSDIGWRRHPDDRATGTFTQVLRGAYGGADHHERAVMATAVYCRYAGEDDFPEEAGIAALLGAEGVEQALKIGLAMRLGFGISSAIEEELPITQLHLTKETLALEAPAKKKSVYGEGVAKRLNDLAKAFDRKATMVT
jgi:exopolyphosphatase/guanosine-5'-triphosphate,3'-diphosphate pyrophosphatase